MTSSLKGAILKTLSYADIFDFPLKKQELYRFLITDKKINRKLFDKAFREIKKERRWIEAERGFYFASAKKRAERVYFLKGREKIVRLRKDKKRWSRKKLKIAKRTAQFLKIIPFVKMVAVTGALAMENSKKEDDIDFLIVAQKGRIWITRFLTTILVEIFAKRRRPGDEKIADKICLNMFLDEEHLTVPVQEQDLFSAHEVVQLKPLWDKERTYEKFLAANQWVKKFWPTQNYKLR